MRLISAFRFPLSASSSRHFSAYCKSSGVVSASVAAGLLFTSGSLGAELKPVPSTPSLITDVSQDWGDPSKIDRQSVIEHTLLPFKGVSHPGVDASTLTGKVMCGYQGWFGAQGDGGARGWTHWGGRNGFRPGSCVIDLWPDVSELAPEERYATAFELGRNGVGP
jgi:hypothetical protein